MQRIHKEEWVVRGGQERPAGGRILYVWKEQAASSRVSGIRIFLGGTRGPAPPDRLQSNGNKTLANKK